MDRNIKRALLLILVALLIFGALFLSRDPEDAPIQTAAPVQTAAVATPAPEEDPPLLDEKGSYTTKEDVALFIHQYDAEDEI